MKGEERRSPDTPLAAARELAARAHAGQTRQDGGPYIEHPLRVAALLSEIGAREELLVAALLHDAVEDSELSVGDVAERHGIAVGELVGALTEDPAIEDWVERKDALRRQVAEAGADAVAIYIADKLANVRDIRRLYAGLGEASIDLHKAPTLELRIAAWRADCALASRATPELELIGPFERELGEFERERGRRVGVSLPAAG